jgi:hypothetical protein
MEVPKKMIKYELLPIEKDDLLKAKFRENHEK